MSEHVQAQKTIAAYVAGGLDPEQGERLEKHLAECAECAAAAAEARALDRKLVALFTHAHPSPALEDRLMKMIQALPPTSRSRKPRLSGKAMTILGAAAAVLLACVGIGVNSALDENKYSPPTTKSAANFVPRDNSSSMEETEGKRSSKGPNELEGLKGLKGKAEEKPDEIMYEPTPRGGLGTGTMVPSAPPPNQVERFDKELNRTKKLYESGVVDRQVLDETIPRGAAKSEKAVDINGLGFGEGGRSSKGAGAGKGGKNGKPGTEGRVSDDKPPADRWTASQNLPGVSNYDSNRLQFAPVFDREKDSKPGEKWNDQLAKNDPTVDFYAAKLLNQKGNKDKELSDGQGKESPSPKLPPFPPERLIPPSLAPPAPAEPVAPPKKLPRESDSDKKDEPRKAEPGEKKKPADAKPGDEAPPGGEQPQQPQPAPQFSRKVIYTAEVEFEVDSFDSSIDIVMQLKDATKGSFVATVNKEKLPNGKMRGIIVLRVPPDLLNDMVGKLIRELAKKGELKNQSLTSADVTKQYTDLESRLRGARSMEERLIKIIKDGKGVIKDLLQAEKELGTWRTKIEELEGELRYYSNLVSLSTLTIKLYERDIRNAAQITENERIQAGIETEDVEIAFKELKALAESKGRVTRSEMKRIAAGQFNAILNFEVPRDSANEVRDRLRQLGTEARLQIDTVQQTDDGGTPSKTGKVVRGDTQFLVSIYNLANMIPSETIIVRLAAADVRKVYDKLKAVVVAEKGPIANAVINDQERTDVNAQLDFDVRKGSVAKIEAALLGIDILARKDATAPPLQSSPVTTGPGRFSQRDDVTDSRVRYLITLIDADSLRPRETKMFRIVADNVQASFDKLQKDLKAAGVKTRLIPSKVLNQDARKSTANLDFSYDRGDDQAVIGALVGAGDILSSNVERKPDAADVTDAKILARVVLVSADSIAPRDTFAFMIVTPDVARTYEELKKSIKSIARDKVRYITKPEPEKGPEETWGELNFDVPSDDASNIQPQLEKAGEIVFRNRKRLAEGDDVTDAKVRFLVQVVDTNSTAVIPREKITLKIAAEDVKAAFNSLRKTLGTAKARIFIDKINDKDRAQLRFTIVRAKEADLKDALAATGETLSNSADWTEEKDRVSDSRVWYEVDLVSAANNVAPRESTTLVVEVTNVAKALNEFDALVKQIPGGQSSKPNWSVGSTVVKVEYTVPLAAAPGLLEKFRAGGIERTFEPTTDPQAPTGKLALARFTVTLSSQPLLTRDEGLTAQLRHGMSISLKGLFTSFGWVLAGLMFVGPWLPVIFVVYLVARRTWRSDEMPMVAVPTSSTPVAEAAEESAPPPS